MQNINSLKKEIITTLDVLPLEGLKLLVEFASFLRAKFQQSVKTDITDNQASPFTYDNGVLIAHGTCDDISDIVQNIREEQVESLLEQVMS